MKRSEMVEHLVDLVNSVVYQDSYITKWEATEILEGLEKLGIQPPNVCFVDGKFDSKKHVEHFYNNKDTSYWESE